MATASFHLIMAFSNIGTFIKQVSRIYRFYKTILYYYHSFVILLHYKINCIDSLEIGIYLNFAPNTIIINNKPATFQCDLLFLDLKFSNVKSSILCIVFYKYCRDI
jgi:hypothetical protein